MSGGVVVFFGAKKRHATANIKFSRHKKDKRFAVAAQIYSPSPRTLCEDREARRERQRQRPRPPSRRRAHVSPTQRARAHSRRASNTRSRVETRGTSKLATRLFCISAPHFLRTRWAHRPSTATTQIPLWDARRWSTNSTTCTVESWPQSRR